MHLEMEFLGTRMCKCLFFQGNTKRVPEGVLSLYTAQGRVNNLIDVHHETDIKIKLGIENVLSTSGEENSVTVCVSFMNGLVCVWAYVCMRKNFIIFKMFKSISLFFFSCLV